MHVYTLVKLKSNRIGLLIVELRPLENLINSRVKRACTEWDGLCIELRSAHAFSRNREPEVEGDDSRVEREKGRFILKGGAEDGGSR